MLKGIIICRSREDEAVKAEQLKKKAEEHGISAVILEIKDKKPSHEYFFAIIRSCPDLVFTLNFAGFEMSTETGEIAYINLPCRNIHLILKEREWDFKRYFLRKLSIAMFFYCQDHEIYDKLQDQYPDIPYLKLMENWDDMLEDVLAVTV